MSSSAVTSSDNQVLTVASQLNRHIPTFIGYTSNGDKQLFCSIYRPTIVEFVQMVQSHTLGQIQHHTTVFDGRVNAEGSIALTPAARDVRAVALEYDTALIGDGIVHLRVDEPRLFRIQVAWNRVRASYDEMLSPAHYGALTLAFLEPPVVYDVHTCAVFKRGRLEVQLVEEESNIAHVLRLACEHINARPISSIASTQNSNNDTFDGTVWSRWLLDEHFIYQYI
jgi:hypothetical protein